MLQTAGHYTGDLVTSDDDYWPGKRFGLPRTGPRSVPTVGKRLAALAIDWVLAVAVSWIWFDYANLWLLGTFIALHALGGLILGGSPGHLALGIRIVPIRGGRLGIVAPLVRPLLIALVLPALIADDDNRGMHDRLVGTILVTR